MARLIQVFEHESLIASKDGPEHLLTLEELDKLYEFNDRNGNIYFTGIKRGVKFNSYVGVIQIGGLTLEILPKTDRQVHYEKKDYQTWREVLLRMLAICQRIRVDAVSEASLSRRYNSLLDLYFIMYLEEVNQLLHQGLIKKYRKQSGNLNALKGRIVFPRHIQQNLIHQERVYTEHQIYDFEHLVNQILLKGLRILGVVSYNPLIRDRINRALLDFPEIKEVDITHQHFDNLRLNRKSEPYRRALNIARMIILNYRPDIKTGHENMLALLFDMNKLWEEYIYRMLKRCETSDVKIKEQKSKPFWERKTIRPDIVVEINTNASTQTYVIDTKWKIPDAADPADNDLKQMFAYNLYWNAGKSMLLYPRHANQSDVEGSFAKLQERLGDNQCRLGFVDVLKDGILNKEIGVEILGKMGIGQTFME
jgi:5-methylcytosine-specific restriction enzyme subunit McrC